MLYQVLLVYLPVASPISILVSNFIIFPLISVTFTDTTEFVLSDEFCTYRLSVSLFSQSYTCHLHHWFWTPSDHVTSGQVISTNQHFSCSFWAPLSKSHTSTLCLYLIWLASTLKFLHALWQSLVLTTNKTPVQMHQLLNFSRIILQTNHVLLPLLIWQKHKSTLLVSSMSTMFIP